MENTEHILSGLLLDNEAAPFANSHLQGPGAEAAGVPSRHLTKMALEGHFLAL